MVDVACADSDMHSQLVYEMAEPGLVVGRRDIFPGAVIERPASGFQRTVLRIEGEYVVYRDKWGEGRCKVHNLICWTKRKPVWMKQQEAEARKCCDVGESEK